MLCNDKDYCVLAVYGLTCPTYPRSTFTQFFCFRKLCLRQNALYLGGHSAQPYIPHQSSRTKGMCVSVIALLIVCQKLCHLSCTLVISIPPKIPLLEFRGQFWGLAEPPRRNSAISHGCTLQHTHMSFQTWSKSVQDKCPKGRIVLVTEKTTRFGTIWQDPPPKFASAHCGSMLIFRVSSQSVQVWGVITEKPFHDPQSEFDIGFFEPITRGI